MDILRHPNPALKQKAAEVDPRADRELKTLASAMTQAMYDAPGVGLAATQVGVLKRVLVVHLDEELVTLCNPTFTEMSKERETDDEGCLSFPGVTVPVERQLWVVCEGLDLEGQTVRIEAEGLLARVLQHEVDHLDGILIIDRASRADRRTALRAYREVQNDRPPGEGAL